MTVSKMTVWVIEIWQVGYDPVLFTASTREKAIEMAEKALEPYSLEVENGERGYELTSTTLDEVFEVH